RLSRRRDTDIGTVVRGHAGDGSRAGGGAVGHGAVRRIRACSCRAFPVRSTARSQWELDLVSTAVARKRDRGVRGRVRCRAPSRANRIALIGILLTPRSMFAEFEDGFSSCGFLTLLCRI